MPIRTNLKKLIFLNEIFSRGLVVAGTAYFIPDWHQMQLVFSVPLVILLGIYWIIPESPR